MAKKSILGKAKKILRNIQTIPTFPNDPNSTRLLSEFIISSSYDETESKTTVNNSLHPFFLNQQIDITVRRQQYFGENYASVHNWQAAPKYLSKKWCAAESMCRNNLEPSNATYSCSLCNHSVHPECFHLFDQDPRCFTCQPPPAQVWNYFSGGLTTFDDPLGLNVSDQSGFSSVSEEKNNFDSDNENPTTHPSTDNTAIPSPQLSPIIEATEGTSSVIPITITATPDDEVITPTPSENSVRFADNVQVNSIMTDPNTTRMQMRIPLVIHGYTSQWTIQQKIHSVLIHLQQLDNTIVVNPWKPSSSESSEPTSLHITNILGMSLDDLAPFFNRITRQPKANDKFLWVDFVLIHSAPWSQLKNGIASWLNRKGYNLYPRELQSPTEITLGWLLWSYRDIDTSILCKALKNDYGIDVHLRWATITLGSPVFPENAVKALHVITTPESHKEALQTFRKLYSRAGQKHFPLSIRMRFIPMHTAVSLSKIDDLKKCRHDQKGWLKCIRSYTYDGIQSLDKSTIQMPTLRALIMKLTAKSESTNKLFVGVNQQWNNPERYVFTFRKKVSQEALARIPTLLTYLINTTPHQMCHRYFTEEAVEISKDYIWDDDSKDVIHPGDLLVPLEAISADILQFDLSQYISYDEDSDLRAKHTEQVFLGIEDSSIATFTSGQSTVQLTGNISDTSSQASSINTEAKNPSTSNEVNTLAASVAKLTKTVSLLDANVKSNTMNSEDILGKIISLKQRLGPHSSSISPNITPDTARRVSGRPS